MELEQKWFFFHYYSETLKKNGIVSEMLQNQCFEKTQSYTCVLEQQSIAGFVHPPVHAISLGLKRC